MVDLLLNKGALVDAEISYLGTPLIHAASIPSPGSADGVSLLLRHGVAVNHRTRKNNSALLFAALSANDPTLQVLLKAGADVNGKHEGEDTALHVAAEKGHLSTCALLIKGAADLNASNIRGQTPLHNAVAADLENEEIIRRLPEAGARVGQTDNEGYTALHTAASHGNVAVADILLQAGTLPSALTKTGSTPLHLAARRSLAITKLLLDNGCPIGARDNFGNTALAWAAGAGNQETAEFLLNAGLLVDTKDKDGFTALYVVTTYGLAEMAELLLQHGAYVNERRDAHRTPLRM